MEGVDKGEEVGRVEQENWRSGGGKEVKGEDKNY